MNTTSKTYLNYISEEDLRKALVQQQLRLSDILVQAGRMDKDGRIIDMQ